MKSKIKSVQFCFPFFPFVGFKKRERGSAPFSSFFSYFWTGTFSYWRNESAGGELLGDVLSMWMYRWTFGLVALPTLDSASIYVARSWLMLTSAGVRQRVDDTDSH